MDKTITFCRDISAKMEPIYLNVFVDSSSSNLTISPAFEGGMYSQFSAL